MTAKKDDTLSPQITTAGDTRRLEFNGTDIAGVTAEPLTPPDHVVYRWLEFSDFEDWSAVANWAVDLFNAGETQSADFKSAAAAINTKSTPEERAVAALEFVQSQIRYFSIALGESSHKPTQPDIVLQRRFGDCKDKALLLVALLKQAGIKSSPVLLSTTRRKGLDQSIPSPSDFDHAIVEASVGGKLYYLDPTRLGQHGRLDRLGKVFEGAQVLVISPETKGLKTIPPAKSPFQRNDLIETAKLPKLDGDGELQVRHIWTGTDAEAMRVLRDQLPADVLKKSFQEAMIKRFPSATLNGDPQYVDDQTNNVMTVTTNFIVPGMATERSGNYLVPFSASNFKGTLAPMGSQARTAPLVIPGHPFNGTYTFKVALPDSIDIWETPFDSKVEGKHFAASNELKYRGNVVTATLSLETRADRIEIADMKTYNDDMQKLVKTALGAVFIPAKLAKVALAKSKSKTPAAAATRDTAETKIEKALRETIKNASTAIDAGKLTPADLARAYILRADAEGDLGDVDKSVADANKAVELAAGDTNALARRAYAYLAAGEFEKSIADYTLALTLGADPGRMYRTRGMANYYLGKFKEAADDFAASGAQTNGETQAYADLWLTAASRRLGKKLPEEVAERAAMASHLEWPHPALAMLNGHLTEDDIIKIIQSKSGLEKVTASSEGYFYIGLSYLLAGADDKARGYFEKSLAAKAYQYEEHRTARL